MILSEQTFIELAGKQEVLDAKIKAAKGITELPLERIELAYRVEAAECVNEMKGDMKYWSDKPMNREAFIEEFVDALHFFLSWVNHAAEGIKKIGIHVGPKEAFKDLRNCYRIVEGEIFEEKGEWKFAALALSDQEIQYSFSYLVFLVTAYKFTEQDIIDTYNRKNAVNHNRSDSGVY